MSKTFDIGVVGFWFGANYGSLLNGYATYKILRSFGVKPLLVHKPGAKLDDWELHDTHNTQFIQMFYEKDEVSTCYPYERLGELNSLCDMFLVGSDQTWNYNLALLFKNMTLLNFTAEDKKRISFASSFGHAHDKTPPEAKKQFEGLLKRFDAISVREQSGVNICEDYGLIATEVMEPVFDIELDEYQRLAEYSRFSESEPYVLTYILDPTAEKRDAILYCAGRLGLKTVNLLDGNKQKYAKNRELLNLPGTLENVMAWDFIKAYMNASFVITDSFHGTAFSVIFNKPFIAITNYGRGATRFEELLRKFDLQHRLVGDAKDIPGDDRFLQAVDFTKASEVVVGERQRAVDWLKCAVETPKSNMPVILYRDCTHVLPAQDCMGCGACVSCCPTEALDLIADELGYYRSIVDTRKCTNCGLCARICPALKLPTKTNHQTPELFAFIAADKDLLFKSSSGGVFSLLARESFKQGGVVVGAAWKDDFSVEHILIDSEEDMPKLRKSKYLQSFQGTIGRQVKNKLEAGAFVLYSGCPCQVAGLKAYLGNKYDNLLLVDMLCGNAPSTMFFQKYLTDSFGEGAVKDYSFRHKVQGWTSDCLTLTLTLTNGNTFTRRGGGEDAYQSVYHNHTMCAPHCESCKYQALPRYGDLTIGDFWGVEKHLSNINHKAGVSAILVNNEKGAAYLNRIPLEEIDVLTTVKLDLLGGNGYAVKGHNYASPNRDRFYAAIKSGGFDAALQAVNGSLATNDDSTAASEILGSNSRAPLQLFTKNSHFIFDGNSFEEHYIGGLTVLTAKDPQSKPGIRAYLLLDAPLATDKTYEISARFKIKSNSRLINFHLYNSKARTYQIVKTVRFESNDEFISFNQAFTPNGIGYDSVMVGAVHITGENAYLAIDYICISEVFE